jgi:hypothetical protein
MFLKWEIANCIVLFYFRSLSVLFKSYHSKLPIHFCVRLIKKIHIIITFTISSQHGKRPQRVFIAIQWVYDPKIKLCMGRSYVLSLGRTKKLYNQTPHKAGNQRLEIPSNDIKFQRLKVSCKRYWSWKCLY